MFERLIRGFATILKAEVLMWLILLTLSGLTYLITLFGK